MYTAKQILENPLPDISTYTERPAILCPPKEASVNTNEVYLGHEESEVDLGKDDVSFNNGEVT